MSNYNTLKTTINANIKQNGNQEITGQILNSVLNQMVTTLGAGYQFAGIATIDTNPGTPDAKVFYIANGKGTYTNFGGLEVTEDDVVVLYYDTEWHKVATGIASQAKLTELETQTTSLNSRTPVDSGISFAQPWELFPEYSEDIQDVQNYILAGFLQINNQMTNVDGLFNHIRDNNLAGKAAYFTISSFNFPSTAIIGNIDTGAVGYKISFSTISRYSDNTSFNNRLIFFEIEIGNLTGDGIIIMNSRLMNIRIKDTLSKIDNNTSKIQALESKNTTLESRIAELENIISQITIKEE